MTDQTEELPNAELTALTTERDDLKDRLLRMTAEFDNYRKRVDRERRELSEAASVDLIRDLLPVVDDLERAMAASRRDAAGTESALLTGVELIHRQILDQLRRRGVEPIDAVGQMFDPQIHESVAAEPAAGKPDGEIIEELRRGYRAGTRLLRASMVKVVRA